MTKRVLSVKLKYIEFFEVIMKFLLTNEENRLFFYSVFASILMMMSFVNIQLTVFTVIFVFWVSLIMDVEDDLIFVCFISCFYKAFKNQSLFASIMLGLFLLITIKAVIKFKHDRWDNKDKKFKIIALSLLAYLVLQPLIYCIALKSIKYEIIKLYTFLLSLILLYFVYGNINLKRITYYFVSAIIISSLIGVIGHFSGLVQYERVFMKDISVLRFSGILFHPNSFARYCLIAIVALICVTQRDYKNTINYILLLLMTFLGFMTYSKSFLILYAFIVLYVVIYSFIKAENKKKCLLVVVISAIIAGLVALIFLPYMKALFNRFGDSFTNGSWLNKLTTGRVDLWTLFSNEFIKSPVYILFGRSYMQAIPSKLGIHSSYFALLYQYGIIGCLVFVAFIYVLLKQTKGWSKNLLVYLPIIMLLLSGLIEDHILTHNGYMYWIITMLFMFNGKYELELSIKAEQRINNFKWYSYCFFKRVFDFTVSLVLLIILAIPLCGVAILIKLTSKGPVFFMDKRVGTNGKTIKVFKFRSMYVDAESRLEQYLTKEQYEMWKKERKVDNDPRITKIGKIIRKTSIDELPQLINILKGELSFIGNRPISQLEYDTHFSEEEKAKLDKMKPGLTGYWQAFGRSNVTYESGERQKMCLYYIENAGVWLDIVIFFKTIESVLFSRGAK